MARKAILKDQNGIEILPITRAELILDSEGNQAFRSASLTATDAEPGLMSPDDKKTLRNAVTVEEVEEDVVVLNYRNATVYPKTVAKAVIINNTNLEDFLENKLTLDDRPTKDSVNGVKSGGVYAEIEDVVGVIYTNLKQV